MATPLKGKSSVNESMVSGEAVPVAKQPGGRLTGGTLSGPGACRSDGGARAAGQGY
jgi:P-type Cu+ transporter